MAKENEKVKDNDGKKSVNESAGSGNIDNVMDIINKDYIPESEKKGTVSNRLGLNLGGMISSNKEEE